MDVSLSNGDMKISDLEDGKWYFIKAASDHSNKITGVKRQGDRIYVQFIGYDFTEPFTFHFTYSQEGLNEFWQYNLQEDYPGTVGAAV